MGRGGDLQREQILFYSAGLALVDGLAVVEQHQAVEHGVEQVARLVDREDDRVSLTGQLF